MQWQSFLPAKIVVNDGPSKPTRRKARQVETSSARHKSAPQLTPLIWELLDIRDQAEPNIIWQTTYGHVLDEVCPPKLNMIILEAPWIIPFSYSSSMIDCLNARPSTHQMKKKARDRRPLWLPLKSDVNLVVLNSKTGIRWEGARRRRWMNRGKDEINVITHPGPALCLTQSRGHTISSFFSSAKLERSEC